MTPYLERTFLGGPQKLYRFANGYGASVVCHRYSYGGAAGLWELAAIRWDGERFDVCLPFAPWEEPHGWLSDAEVEPLLEEINALPKP